MLLSLEGCIKCNQMNKKTLLLFFALCFCFDLVVRSQDIPLKLTDYYKQVEKGIEHHENGKYQDALKCYNSVNRSDPSYPWACYEAALTYYRINEFQNAIDKCREAIWYSYETPQVYSVLSLAYIEDGKLIQGLGVLNSALTKWPYNQNLLFDLAYCYLKLQQYENSEAVLVNSLRLYPYNSGFHSLLAKANYFMGRTAEAYLAFSMALLMNPTSGNISEFESIISGETDPGEKIYSYPYTNPKDEGKWKELKWLIESEVAFNTNFNLQHKLDYLITRQTAMLFSKLVYDPADTSYYNQCYVRFFSSVMKNNYYESYIFFIYQNLNIDLIKQWKARNEIVLNQFLQWSQTNISRWRSFNFDMARELTGKPKLQFDNNGILSTIGEYSRLTDSIKHGEWIYLNENGAIREEGNYNNNLLDGSYKIYWENGRIKQDLQFKNDTLDGYCYTFHENGEKAGDYFFVRGKKEGNIISRTLSGLIEDSETYSKDIYNGISFRYDYQSALISRINYENNIANGLRERFWMNGIKELEFNFTNDTINGRYQSWYEDGKLRVDGNYKKGYSTGHWKFYHRNGELQSEGDFDSLGNYSGKWFYYSMDGKLIAQENGYIDGKLIGTRTEYHSNGNASIVYNYLANQLNEITVYDTLENKLFHSSINEDNTIELKTFYPDGVIRSYGSLIGMNRTGHWKFYNPHGILIKEENYIDGLLEGEQKSFFINGQIREEYSCDSNVVEGFYREYYINGKVKSEGVMVKGNNEGEWISYYPNGMIENRSYWKDGKMVGFYEEYLADGTKYEEYYYDSDGLIRYIRFFNSRNEQESEAHIRNGNGELIRYYRNGQIKDRSIYKGGFLHDTAITYFPDGKICSTDQYIYGKLNGLSNKWDRNGRLIRETNYILGVATGVDKVYDEGTLIYESDNKQDLDLGRLNYYHYNGKVYRQLSYRNGESDGFTYSYTPEGNFMYRFNYANGTLKSFTYKDKNGNFVKEIPVTPDTKQIIAYYPNGKISTVCSINNGVLDGKRVEYFANGKVFRETDFLNGFLMGMDKTYYPNGNIEEEAHYLLDNLQGSFVKYYENGTRKYSGQYMMNWREGKWEYFNSSGKLMEVITYRKDQIDD